MCDHGTLVDRLPAGGAGTGQASSQGGMSSSGGTALAEQAVSRHIGPSRSVASAACLWGTGAIEAPVETLRQLPLWRLGLDPLQVHADVHHVGGLERSIGLLSNCQTVLPMLTAASTKAAAMLRASAYVHQYERHGVGREEMSEALLNFIQVQHDYEQL